MTAPATQFVDAEQDELRQVFLAELDAALATMEAALVELETQPGDAGLVETLFRAAHTVKGGAAMVGFAGMAEFAHALEDALVRLRDGTASAAPGTVTLLLHAVDALRAIGARASAGAGAVSADEHALLERLAAATVAAPAPTTAAAPSDSASPAPRADAVALPTRAQTVRVGLDRLDALLDRTGEVAVARARLLQVVAADAARGADALAAADELDRLLAGLQDEVMRLRLVPLGPTLRQHGRTVRDAATECDKLVRLEVAGGDVEVDAAIAEQLREPLLHLVRNAVDHGLELPAARQLAGKDPCGTVSIRAYRNAAHIVVEVADDGAGIDVARVTARARERGLLDPTATPNEAEAHELIFRPGFSTAGVVTSVSGRGVGMDVVRRSVSAVRGTVHVASAPGRGTTFTLRIPLTLAIVDGFVVGVGDESFVVPLDAVVECATLPAAALRDDGTGVLHLAGHPPIPLLHLRTMLPTSAPRAARESVVVVRHADTLLGLVADVLHGASSVVIKPLGAAFERLPGVAGSTILGSGRVALILDVSTLLDAARVERRAPSPAGASAPGASF